jgi:hypothetical protein
MWLTDNPRGLGVQREQAGTARLSRCNEMRSPRRTRSHPRRLIVPAPNGGRHRIPNPPRVRNTVTALGRHSSNGPLHLMATRDFKPVLPIEMDCRLEYRNRGTSTSNAFPPVRSIISSVRRTARAAISSARVLSTSDMSILLLSGERPHQPFVRKCSTNTQVCSAPLHRRTGP